MSFHLRFRGAAAAFRSIRLTARSSNGAAPGRWRVPPGIGVLTEGEPEENHTENAGLMRLYGIGPWLI